MHVTKVIVDRNCYMCYNVDSDRVTVTCGPVTHLNLCFCRGFFDFRRVNMHRKQRKEFLTYDEQIDHLISKKMIIKNRQVAIEFLKRYSYYGSVSAYKNIFKLIPNGDYIEGTTFEQIISLYYFDKYLRVLFLRNILVVEDHIKSLYSYHFCELIGKKPADYLIAENYNFRQYENGVQELLVKLNEVINKPATGYIKYNVEHYGEVPLWVLIHALTLGNLSKMYEFSQQRLQSAIAKNFNSKEIYPNNLKSMLKMLAKFRNVCAHNERLYSYKTRTYINDMPIHKCLKIDLKGDMYKYGKNDLFAIIIILKYLLPEEEFKTFIIELSVLIENVKNSLPDEIFNKFFDEMGFPDNWQTISCL